MEEPERAGSRERPPAPLWRTGARVPGKGPLESGGQGVWEPEASLTGAWRAGENRLLWRDLSTLESDGSARAEMAPAWGKGSAAARSSSPSLRGDTPAALSLPLAVLGVPCTSSPNTPVQPVGARPPRLADAAGDPSIPPASRALPTRGPQRRLGKAAPLTESLSSLGQKL